MRKVAFFTFGTITLDASSIEEGWSMEFNCYNVCYFLYLYNIITRKIYNLDNNIKNQEKYKKVVELKPVTESGTSLIFYNIIITRKMREVPAREETADVEKQVSAAVGKSKAKGTAAKKSVGRKLPTRTSKGSHEINDYMSSEERFKVFTKNFKNGEFIAYTDGSCWNLDPNRCGGAAYVVMNHEGAVVKANHKGFVDTSNNRMEMLAIISAVASVPEGCRLVVFTDSEYAINSFESDFYGISNEDLIALYHKYAKRLRSVTLRHTRGHVGTPLNEFCDYWANWEYHKMREKLTIKTKIT